MIVVDTCVLIHLYNKTSLTTVAEQVLEIDPYWLIPPLWREEYANVLSKLTRKENRALDEVLLHYEYICNDLKEFERSTDASQALKFSIQNKISVYDAHFVVLAIENNTCLVTEDKEILKNCPKYTQNMKQFCIHMK